MLKKHLFKAVSVVFIVFGCTTSKAWVTYCRDSRAGKGFVERLKMGKVSTVSSEDVVDVFGVFKVTRIEMAVFYPDYPERVKSVSGKFTKVYSSSAEIDETDVINLSSNDGRKFIDVVTEIGDEFLMSVYIRKSGNTYKGFPSLCDLPLFKPILGNHISYDHKGKEVIASLSEVEDIIYAYFERNICTGVKVPEDGWVE